MNSANYKRSLFVGLFLTLFLVGCAATPQRESTGQYIDDSAITAKVKAEIFHDPMLKVFQISVESYKGVVQLSGFVNSEQASAKATEVAESVEGVKSVKNSLVVK
jgi:osmotically-inducible protein OsmY